MSSQKKADLIFLRNFSKGDNNIVRKYITIFLRSNKSLIANMTKEIKLLNWPEIENSAHSLKTQFNFIGCNEGEELSRKIKFVSENGKDQTEVQKIFKKIQILTETLYSELENELI